MRIQVFRAANLQSALEEIREQLGPQASVLKTRQCRDGWMGWLGRSYVEVTASADQLASPEALEGFVQNLEGSPATLRLDQAERLASSGSHGFPENDFAGNTTSRDRQSSLFDTRLSGHFGALLSLGIDPQAANRWIHETLGFASGIELPMADMWPDLLRSFVRRELKIGGPIRLNPQGRRIVALVGPTGVGKTTTIAKLAAGFRVRSQRKVGLLTIDTFRIAAVQQLQSYAEIMDLPMGVVESADQMSQALEGLGDVDLVLIDTVGRSPSGDRRIDALAELLRWAKPDETHLVISATSNAAVVRAAIEGYAITKPTATILTKLDEAPYTANVLSGMTVNGRFTCAPISYITNGQQVPDDIAIATGEELVDKLLPESFKLRQLDAA